MKFLTTLECLGSAEGNTGLTLNPYACSFKDFEFVPLMFATRGLGSPNILLKAHGLGTQTQRYKP